jgi:hypothetical protein
MGLAVHRITNYYFWKQNALHEALPPRSRAPTEWLDLAEALFASLMQQQQPARRSKAVKKEALSYHLMVS